MAGIIYSTVPSQAGSCRESLPASFERNEHHPQVRMMPVLSLINHHIISSHHITVSCCPGYSSLDDAGRPPPLHSRPGNKSPGKPSSARSNSWRGNSAAARCPAVWPPSPMILLCARPAGLSHNFSWFPRRWTSPRAAEESS
jgi:hypothetical protein